MINPYTYDLLDTIDLSLRYNETFNFYFDMDRDSSAIQFKLSIKELNWPTTRPNYQVFQDYYLDTGFTFEDKIVRGVLIPNAIVKNNISDLVPFRNRTCNLVVEATDGNVVWNVVNRRMSVTEWILTFT